MMNSKLLGGEATTFGSLMRRLFCRFFCCAGSFFPPPNGLHLMVCSYAHGCIVMDSYGWLADGYGQPKQFVVRCIRIPELLSCRDSFRNDSVASLWNKKWSVVARKACRRREIRHLADHDRIYVMYRVRFLWNSCAITHFLAQCSQALGR